MAKMKFGLALALVCGLAAVIAGPAAAYENTLKAGDPAWVLDGFSASTANVTIWSDGGQLSGIQVTATYSDTPGTPEPPRTMRVWGTSPARTAFSRPGAVVEKLSFVCTTGAVRVLAEGEQGSQW